MNKTTLLLLFALCGVTSFSQNMVWARGVGGSQADVSAAIAVDAAGNVYTAGNFQGTADFDPGPAVYNLTAVGNSDAYVCKLDAQGNFVWAVGIGGPGTDAAAAIASDSFGNVVITGSYSNTVDFDPGNGTFNMTSAGYYDCFIMKLDAAGNFVWAGSIGDAGYDQGSAIALDQAGNIYVAGGFDTYVDMDPGSGVFNLSAGYIDAFICKLDGSGSFIWAGGIGGAGLDFPLSVSLDAAGNIYTSGRFASASADFDPGIGTFNLSAGSALGNGYVCKLDGNGNFIWAGGFLGSGICYANSVQSNGNGDVFITGAYSAGIDFDPGSGTALSTAAGSTPDAYITKLNSAGNYVWSKFISSTLADQGLAMVMDPAGNIVVSGYFGNTADFDPGPALVNFSSNGGNDIFIATYDWAGNYVSAYTAGSTGSDNGNALTMDGAGNLYATGSYQNSVNFTPQTILASSGNSDGFALKFQKCSSLSFTQQPVSQLKPVSSTVKFVAMPSSLSSGLQWQSDAGFGFVNLSNAGQFSGVNTATLTVSAVTLVQNGVKFRCILSAGSCTTISDTAVLSVYNDVGFRELKKDAGWSVYPNPASEQVTLKLTPALLYSSYTICDQSGRLVMAGRLTEMESILEINTLAKGLYLLQVQGSGDKPVKLTIQ